MLLFIYLSTSTCLIWLFFPVLYHVSIQMNSFIYSKLFSANTQITKENWESSMADLLTGWGHVLTHILWKEALPVLEVIYFSVKILQNRVIKFILWSKLWKKTWIQLPDLMIQTFCMTLGKLFNVSSSDKNKVTSFLPLCLIVWSGLFLFFTIQKKKKKKTLGPQPYSTKEQTYFKESREREPAKGARTTKKILGISGDRSSAK